MVVLEIACHSYCDNNITILCVRGRIRAQSHSPRTSGPRSIDLSSRRDGISCLQGCPWRTRVHLSPFTQRRVARSVLRAWWTLSERQYHYQLWSITLEWLRIILTLATSFLLILVNNVLDCNSLMSGLARGITSDIYIYIYILCLYWSRRFSRIFVSKRYQSCCVGSVIFGWKVFFYSLENFLSLRNMRGMKRRTDARAFMF